MGGNTFQPRVISSGYNPRYYNSGVEINYNRNYNQNNGFLKLHATSCRFSPGSGYKLGNNKSRYNYSVMCATHHINNYKRGHNI